MSSPTLEHIKEMFRLGTGSNRLLSKRNRVQPYNKNMSEERRESIRIAGRKWFKKKSVDECFVKERSKKHADWINKLKLDKKKYREFLDKNSAKDRKERRERIKTYFKTLSMFEFEFYKEKVKTKKTLALYDEIWNELKNEK